MLFGVDQGAAITFDGGVAWSSYYALPVGQFYHISTDNRYPYWIIASQQDTGAVMTRERGDMGTISEVDWMPVPSSEFGTLTMIRWIRILFMAWDMALLEAGAVW